MEITPTRSALLEARDERHVMGEGFRFLDEKRMLLAAEMVRQVERYREQHALFDQQRADATTALKAAIARHGLEGIGAYPARVNDDAHLKREIKPFFGVTLVVSVTWEWGDPPPPRPPAHPSPEARICQRAFEELMRSSATLAAISGNLHRLISEYKKTERRARALEDVVLPELDEAIHEMDMRLEEMEQEEAVRVRLGRVAF